MRVKQGGSYRGNWGSHGFSLHQYFGILFIKLNSNGPIAKRRNSPKNKALKVKKSNIAKVQKKTRHAKDLKSQKTVTIAIGATPI